MTKILVTAALPYANGSIHIGHLVEYIQTDIYVRFLKLIGKNAIYCCADDTHGTAIEVSAKKQGVSPEKLIAKYSKEHQEDFKLFLIEFDSYYSTNSEENREYAELIFNKANEKGLIYKKKIQQHFCEHDKRVLPDRFIKGECPKCGAKDQYGDVCESCSSVLKADELINPKCVDCDNTPILQESEHYFFKLSEYSDKLKEWLESNKSLQEEVKHYVLNWIKEGLHDWDITRDGPYFGFKIPGEDNKYFYVWLDAPVGYIASTANYCRDKENLTELDYWKKDADSEIIHFIGKDIIYFHYLFWPAELDAGDFKLPDTIVTHGFLTVNGEKMSKSRGTFFTAKEFAKTYTPEYLRYYFASMLSKKMSDIDLDFKDFVGRVNHEIVGNISNFCYRTLSFIKTHQDGKIGNFDEKDPAIKEFLEVVEKIRGNYENINFKEAVKEIMSLAHISNQYFQKNAPWKMEKGEELDKVLCLAANFAKNIAIVLKPILPEFSGKLLKQLNLPDLKWEDINFTIKDHKVGKAEHLANKIEEKIETKEEFPLNIKVGEIKEAKNHPDSDKLVILQVDVGEPRQIVAGIQQDYKTEELKGLKLAIVTNLKKAKLGGVESNGMLLAAGDEPCRLLHPEGDPGDQIYPGEKDKYVIKTGKIEYKKFQKVKMKVKDKKIIVDKVTLRTDKGDVHVDAKDDEMVS